MVSVRSLKVGLVLLLASLLQGCPRAVNTVLYNNSQNDLLVLNADKELTQWRFGTVLRIDGGHRWLTIRNEKGHVIPLLVVREDIKSFEYKLSFYGLPGQYIGHSSGGAFSSDAIEYSLQLEPDRNLYVVKPSESFPARHLYPHPITPELVLK